MPASSLGVFYWRKNMCGEFAIRIFPKTGESIYLYRGTYAEIPKGENPERYIDKLIRDKKDRCANYKVAELCFIPVK